MTTAAIVILSALVGGLSGAIVVVVYDYSARKRVLEILRSIAEKHKNNDKSVI